MMSFWKKLKNKYLLCFIENPAILWDFFYTFRKKSFTMEKKLQFSVSNVLSAEFFAKQYNFFF